MLGGNVFSMITDISLDSQISRKQHSFKQNQQSRHIFFKYYNSLK
jgi:hypothetical protein